MNVIEDASIVNNAEIASGVWQLEVEAPHICAEYTGPGQFISFSLPMIAGNTRFGVQ